MEGDATELQVLLVREQSIASDTAVTAAASTAAPSNLADI